jgi:hypothetical protein
MSRRLDAHPSNSDGPFYVLADECIACGAAEQQAKGLMSHDDNGSCFFARQPFTTEETDAAIRALWSSCCEAIRYSGDDVAILTRIAQIGSASACDKQLKPQPAIVIRDHVTFNYVGSHDSSSTDLRQIITFISDGFPASSYARNSHFVFGKSSGSFLHHWGTSDSLNSIKLRVENKEEGKWLVALEDNDLAKVGTAMSLDAKIQANELIKNINWFTKDELVDHPNNGCPHPY